jgi:MoaA/NifB/PqqE/SkfB family radical SAM enzyme
LMARAGLAIELRTVAMRPNADALPELARFVAAHLPFVSVWAIMQLENIGFARKNWDGLFFDNSAAFGPVGAAIDIARAKGLNVSLYNFPLCTVPPAYRQVAAASISDWKRRYLGFCDNCELKSSCGGFFEWYPERRGFSRLGLS